MKLVVFAHVPPPHHGQSYMVLKMIEGLGGDQRKRHGPRPEVQSGSPRSIQCYHVNAQFANDTNDMGTFRLGKALLLSKYILQALRCRIRFRADVLYYCPAMAQKATLLRDIIVLLTLRPFFRKTVFHWHSSGLGEWLETHAPGRILSLLGHAALRDADLALTPGVLNVPDLLKFNPKRYEVVPNGIPDPCPDFANTLLPERRKRFEEWRKPASSGAGQPSVRLLYLALCTEDKGLLDAVRAIHLLKSDARFRSPYRFSLTVAGRFLSSVEEEKFRRLVNELRLQDEVSYAGFVSGHEKNRLLREHDLFCFPTYFSGENSPVALSEAMAFGLPIVTTRWRNIPDFLPEAYPGLVEIKQPEQVASAVLKVLTHDQTAELRRAFLERFTIETHLQNLERAILSIDRKPAEAATSEVSPSLPAGA